MLIHERDGAGNLQLMRDLVHAAAAGDASCINLGVGNPSPLPSVSTFWWRKYRTMLESESRFYEQAGAYADSRGHAGLRSALAQRLNASFDWRIDESNVLVTAGSQMASYAALNLYCRPDGHSVRTLALPLSPEYPGAWDCLPDAHPVVSTTPRPRITAAHQFVYDIDLDALGQARDVGLYWLSRPCNPSGYVATADDLRWLFTHAERTNARVFVDCAYGLPVPALQFVEPQLAWSPNAVYGFSISKAGLPGERIGVAVAEPETIASLNAIHSRACIHASRLAQGVIMEALTGGALERLCREEIAPTYQRRHILLREVLTKALGATPWFLHEHQGGLFAWLWVAEDAFAADELYDSLKWAGVLVGRGSSFLPRACAAHARSCIRISLTESDARLEQAAKVIGDVVQRCALRHRRPR